MSLDAPATSQTRGKRPESLFGYEIIDALGEGARSTIYAACHSGTNQLFALKHVVCETEKDQRFIQQLQTECDVGRKVNHPGLRCAIELKCKRTWLWKISEAVLVLELVDGIPIDVQRPHDLPALLGCFIKTAEALYSLHQLGYVHCDLKPNNVLLNVRGEVKVIDLGQACPIMTKKERIQGTPDYIAPEQVRCQPVTPRTDIYNLGASLYFMLTGRKYPTLYIQRSQKQRVSDDQVPPPVVLNPAVPEMLSQLTMDCVRSNVVDRPRSMSDVIQRLNVVKGKLVS